MLTVKVKHDLLTAYFVSRLYQRRCTFYQHILISLKKQNAFVFPKDFSTLFLFSLSKAELSPESRQQGALRSCGGLTVLQGGLDIQI